ncbi:MAG: cold shock domain-containing protein [Bifidobacteriaceae bacterium]|nr:cold shock domain-containing protein [Bifidobacteriaceae bacterium]
MPTGKVKWFDAERGFGFITGDDGTDAFLHASSLPDDSPPIRQGTRLEYGIAESRRGPSALTPRVLSTPTPAVRRDRKSGEEMVVIIEDLIKLLDTLSTAWRRGRGPDRKTATQAAQLLRAVAGDIEP